MLARKNGAPCMVFHIEWRRETLRKSGDNFFAACTFFATVILFVRRFMFRLTQR